jgi:hypothetical protein
MTELDIRGRVGPDVLADGALAKVRLGKAAEQIFQHAHGRLYETNYRNALFSGGMGLTAINNVTFTTGTLGATCTPVAGVWNPSGSGVNVVIVQATLGLTMTALQATGGAPFVWASSVGNGAPSTGAQAFSRSTGLASGAKARDMTNAALTGLTNNLVVRGASVLGGGSAEGAAFLATAVAMQTQQVSYIEYVDGAIFVPPGGVLALLATTTPVAHSAASMILWEEVLL